MDEDAKESGGLFVWVSLQLGLDLDDECRGHGREQTGLSLKLARVRRIWLETHEYQGGVQIFVVSLDEVLVILFGLLVVFRPEHPPGSTAYLCLSCGGGGDFNVN